MEDLMAAHLAVEKDVRMVAMTAAKKGHARAETSERYWAALKVALKVSRSAAMSVCPKAVRWVAKLGVRLAVVTDLNLADYWAGVRESLKAE